jgi:hypothetical protein
LALVMSAAFATSSAGLGAQTTNELVNQRRLEYRAAKDAYESAVSAGRVLEQQFSLALEQVRRARRQGDDTALEQAYALAQDRSFPYSAQEERIDEARATLDSARTALIEIITVRLEELVGEMDAAASAQQRNALNAVWTDLDNELKNLEAEAGEGFRIDPVVMPEIVFDPRDGPEELQAKAEILERRAAVADTLIQNTDETIDQLTARLRVERQRRDFLANADRFGDTQVPVVTGQPAGERSGAPADSTSAGSGPLTLEERIGREQAYREDLVQYRDQLLIRARQFRQRVRSVAQ